MTIQKREAIFLMVTEILQYQTAKGRRPFGEWLLSLKDKTFRARLLARLDRLLLGNFGDTKRLAAGIWELRFHFGPGYRVYFGLDEGRIVILLCGGDKSSQTVDIDRAHEYWLDYLRRK